MFCEKCGAKNPDGSQFCSACGSPMGGAAPTPTQARKAAPAASAGGKKIDLKVVVILAVAVLAVLVLLFMFLGRSGGSGQSGNGEAAPATSSDISGKWYVDRGALREVFCFHKNGSLYIWNESGGYSNDDGSTGTALAKWSVSGNTLHLKCDDDSKMLVQSYFGTTDPEIELADSGSTLILHTNMGKDFEGQKYPSTP